MMYKPSEIAGELGITVDTIHRSYLPAGAPCEQDAKGYVWIHGVSFANWARIYLSARARTAGARMQDSEVWCCKCNRVVFPKEVHTSRPNGRGVANRHGRCPLCHGKVNRFLKVEPKKKAVL
jgi:hypothetical protein